MAAPYPGLLPDQAHHLLEILKRRAIRGVLRDVVKPDGTMQHTLVMGEGTEALFAMVATHAALSHAAKR